MLIVFLEFLVCVGSFLKRICACLGGALFGFCKICCFQRRVIML